MVEAMLGPDILNFMDVFFTIIKFGWLLRRKLLLLMARDLFFYKVMSFDLKNIGATYQCLANKIFKD